MFLHIKNIKSLFYIIIFATSLSACKIDFEGDKEAVKKLLQGQITSDIEESGSSFFQPSAICDAKGFVIADFLILNAKEMISVIIHNY